MNKNILIDKYEKVLRPILGLSVIMGASAYLSRTIGLNETLGITFLCWGYYLYARS